MSAFISAMQNWLMMTGGESGECEELGKIWVYIQSYPHSPFFSENATSEEAKGFIDETGGSVWWCNRCDSLASINRTCDCGCIRPSTMAKLAAHSQR